MFTNLANNNIDVSPEDNVISHRVILEVKGDDSLNTNKAQKAVQIMEQREMQKKYFSNEAADVHIIIPKEFEFAKILTCLWKSMVSISLINYDDCWVQLKHGSFPITIRLTVIRDSDIGFFIKCLSILKEKHVKYLLIGTCGYTPLNNRDPKMVGDILYCTTARKIDRGTLDSLGYHIDGDVLQSSATDNLVNMISLVSQISKVTTNSGNFLLNLQIEELKGFGYDMESYDFMKVCEINNVECIGCVRVISDIIGTSNSALTRSTCAFDKAALFLENMLAVLCQARTVRYNHIQASSIPTLVLSMQFNKIMKVLTKEMSQYSVDQLSQNKINATDYLKQQVGKLKLGVYDKNIEEKLSNYITKIDELL